MSATPATPHSNHDLRDVLRLLHGKREGSLGIFSGLRLPDAKPKDPLSAPSDRFFAYPSAIDAAVQHIQHEVAAGREVYWCAHLLTDRRRIKANAAPITALYADIDHDQLPANCPKPSVIIESSPGRYQGYWLSDGPIDPQRAELINKRLAVIAGADGSGYDLTQLLRIPGTPNRKHPGPPLVRVVDVDPNRRYSADELESILPPLPEKPKPTKPAFHLETAPLTVDDDLVLRRARLSTRFRDTDAGDDRHYAGNANAADQAYCDALVAAGADSADQVDRLFRASRRMRDKWDEVHYASGETYGQHTAEKAFDGYVQNRYAGKVTPIRPRPTHPAFQDETAPPATVVADAPGDRCQDWHERALAAEAENLELRRKVECLDRQVDTLELEIGELRIENSTIIQVTTHPDLKAEAPTLIRTAIEYRDAKRTGQVDDRGFMKLNTRKVGDDWDDPIDGVDRPIRSRSTVGRHLQNGASYGLLEREIRAGVVQRVMRDPNTKQMIEDPATGKPRTFTASVDQAWIKMQGDTLTDILRPMALFRARPSLDTDVDPVKPVHGGDRRSEAAKARVAAKRTPCPDCGGTDRYVICTNCAGLDLTAIAEADEQRLINENIRLADALDAANALLAGVPFQDDSLLVNRGPTVPFQDETAPLEQLEIEQAWAAWSKPASPSLDWRTDIAYGMRASAS